MQFHSSAMLEFYGWLLGVQEDIHERARAGRWLDAAGETADTTRSVRLNGGQDAARDDAFVDLLRHLAQAELATDVVRTAAGSMVDVGRERREMLLRSVLDRRGVADPSSQLPHNLEPHTFLGRAFLQPLAEAMATREADNDGTAAPTSCPQCGWPPQVAAVCDERDVKGRRTLVCSLCATAWVFPRVTCPACREARPDSLETHTSESLAHIRIESCRACGAYMKSVDLRVDGLAVPVVDDLGSVELDLWAQQQGLEKLQRNLLGL